MIKAPSLDRPKVVRWECCDVEGRLRPCGLLGECLPGWYLWVCVVVVVVETALMHRDKVQKLGMWVDLCVAWAEQEHRKKG